MRALLLLLAALSAPAATVATFDGKTLTGDTLAIDAKALTVTVGATAVALADADWIEPGNGAGPPALGNRTYQDLWLADGSWLPVTALKAGAADHTLSLDGPLGPLELPLQAVRGWGGSEPPATADQTDQVVLDGGPVNGRVEGIVAGKLILRSALDPNKPLELPLNQVHVLRLAGAVKAPRGISLSLRLDDAHPPLRLLPVQSGVGLAASPQTEMGKLLANARWRVEGGRRTYLSELTPDTVEETGAFGVVWPWKKDANLDGTPLRLGGVRYVRGVVVHSQAKLAWKLDGSYLRLRALVGIADVVADQGDCAAALIADGKTLWTRDRVKGGDKPIALDLDLTGVKRLELRVDYGQRYDIGDHLALADAYLVKAK